MHGLVFRLHSLNSFLARPRRDGYIYLYSSMTTLDVRTTLQCGEIVQITGRYETYCAMRTAKGEVGYAPLASIVVFKDLGGAGLPRLAAPSRERISYDARPDPPPPPVNPPFVLPKGTQVHLKVLKTLTSATAHTSDAMEFAVIEDVLVDGVVVIPKGAKANGVVDTDVQLKREAIAPPTAPKDSTAPAVGSSPHSR